QIFAVNPKHREAHGLRCYPTIADVPRGVDLAVIVTPAATTPSVIQECVAAGVRSTVVISAGYKERGAEGAALENEIARGLRAGDMPLVGPNCLGIMNPLNGLNATFADSLALPGNVAFISQSGALCTAILDWSLQEKVGFSSFVSTGSMLDVGWGDLIRYFGEDPYTKSILLYIESIEDGADFLAAAKEVTPRKPIIVIKAGRTAAASKAASSHTGAMTGNDAVMDVAFRQAGILRVERISDLFYMAEIFSKQPLPQGPRLTILTNAGGPGVLATDALLGSGGELTPLDPAVEASLNEVLPPHWSHANPIDILGDADPQRYARAFEIAAADPTSDGILVVLAPQGMTDPAHCAAALLPYVRQSKKPVLASWMGGKVVEPAQQILNGAGISTFPYPDTAARAFTYMWEFAKRRNSLVLADKMEAQSLDIPVEGRLLAMQVIEVAQRAGRSILTEVESKQVLEAYGIPTVPTFVAATPEEAVAIAQHLRYPVVMKLHSETLTHKSDVGGVRLGLDSDAAVQQAFTEMRQEVSLSQGAEHFLGATLQPMIRRDGYELIVGSSTDPQFGPVMLFGLGGVLTEVFHDTALALPPLTRGEAYALISRTRISAALKGIRNRRAVHLSLLADTLIRYSHMMVEVPEIAESDINPLLVWATGVIALDARIVLKAGTPLEKASVSGLRGIADESARRD
ncbi:MAG TPA: acetate--CoA ligase family protein, partial [Terriglobales bacterium]|nr:acetate--CoA ligase family protein [Terriglobales bacterium]